MLKEQEKQKEKERLGGMQFRSPERKMSYKKQQELMSNKNNNNLRESMAKAMRMRFKEALQDVIH